MKSQCLVLIGVASLSGLLLAGCASRNYSHTSPYQPGPVAGRTVGGAVGVAAGNVAGAGVGLVEGAAVGAASSFNPDYRVVRYWRTEITSDGRTIQVPYDVLVDQYGRPVHMPAPTRRPAPPPRATVDTNAPAQNATNAPAQ